MLCTRSRSELATDVGESWAIVRCHGNSVNISIIIIGMKQAQLGLLAYRCTTGRSTVRLLAFGSLAIA